MDYTKGKIVKFLIDFFGEDYRGMTHALEVLRYSESTMARYSDCDYDVVVASAPLHDLG